LRRIADDLEVIEPYRACLLEDAVIIADVHLGYEEAMTLDGTSIYHRQIEDLKRMLDEIFEKTGATKLIINGDLKHTFERASPEEWEDLPEFVEKALEKAKEIILIRGNHDTILGPIRRYERVKIVDELKIGDFKLVHGHRGVAEENLIIAHEHPMILLGDRVGGRVKVPCFLHHEELRITVLPAFSPIVGGTPVNLLRRGEFLSPILNQTGVDEMRVICVDEEAGILEFPEIKRWRDVALHL